MYFRPRAGRFRHLLQRCQAVGFRGVHMQITLDVSVGDQHREIAGVRPAEFLACLPQFRRKDGQVEGPVNVFFRGSGHVLLMRAIHTIHAVLIDFQPPLFGAPAQHDIVFLRTREVLQRRAERFSRDHAQVNL